MAKQVTINLSFNTSNGSYSLSSTNTSLAQISGTSFIIKGKTYTPTVSKSSTVNKKYRLNSWTMPSGPTVGTNSPSSSKSGSPNTTSDYTSSEVNYYTSHTTLPTYDYETLSISINSSTGVISGDTSYCSVSKKSVDSYSAWSSNKKLSVGVSIEIDESTGKIRETPYSLFTYSKASWGGGSEWAFSSVNLKTMPVEKSDTYRYNCSRISRTNSSKHPGYYIGARATSNYYQTRTKTTSYQISSVSWDSTATINGYSYSKYGSASTTSTSSSQQYRRQTSSGSTTYNPNIYAKFTFDSSTGDISWSFRGTGSTNTTYTNKIKNNSTFDIDDLSTTTYTHNSTDWNVDDLTIVSQSKTSITISVPTISWKFTDKEGTTSTGSIIKFISKDGVTTIINKINFRN